MTQATERLTFNIFERGDPNKMWVIIKEKEWLEEHAYCKDFEWFCKETSRKIALKLIGRSIWFSIIPEAKGGGGEVRQISHFYCPACGQEPDIEYGTPIYDNEVTGLDPVNEIIH